MSNGLPHLRKKTAKGRAYYYFDAGMDDRGQRVLTKLPDIKDPRFGGCYARAKAERGKHKDSRGVLTLDGLIRSYEKSPEFRGLTASSQYNYLLYLGVANRFMRNKNGFSAPAEAIKRKDILAIREKLADTPGAANSAMRALGALFRWAVDNEKVKESPATKIRRFPAKPHKEWPDDLLDEALSDPQIGLAVALFYFTGQRINEVVKMNWADIEGDYMRVFVQKKRTHLRVAILPELADRLSAVTEKTAVTILTSSNGRPWSKVGLRSKLQAWAKERGHKVVPHGLRKNAVNALLEAGCTPAEVQGITDQSIPMIQHYAKGVNKLKLGRAAVVKLDAARRARNKEGK